jgi:hypothetical protein
MAFHNQVGPPAPRSRKRAILIDSLGKLWAWVFLPGFADEEKSRAASTLYVLSLSLMAMGTFSLVEEWVHSWTGAAWTLAHQ